MTTVSGMIAPAATPRPVRDKISGALAAVLAMPSTLEFMVKQGAEPYAATPDEAQTVIHGEIDRYAKIIKSAGIRYNA